MNNFYSYAFNCIASNKKQLVIFYPGPDVDHKKIIDLITTEYRGKAAYDGIVFIAPINCKTLSAIINSPDAFLTEIRDANNLQVNPTVSIFLFDEHGKINYREINNNGTEELKDRYEDIYDSGCLNIFIERDLVVNASENHHFSKPSKKHSKRFIRASNVLQKGAESYFLSLRILKYITENIESIYVDTSGITSLIHSALHLRHNISLKPNYILVDSYGSYGGYTNYQFGTGSSVVFISASTSNNLFKKLKEVPDLFPDSIVSLFYNSNSAAEHNIIFDFSRLHNLIDDGNKNKALFSPILSYKEEDCPHCHSEHSTAINLTADQFLVEHPSVETYLPRAIDANKFLRSVISRYNNSSSLKCLYDGLSGTKTGIEFFIDVKSLIETQNPKYIDKMNSVFKRNMTAWISDIFYCSDAGALELATEAKNYYEKEFELELNLYPVEKIDEIAPEDIKKGVLVVAASTQSGRALLNVSRSLRKYREAPLTYLVGFLKYHSTEQIHKIKSDLTFCDGPFGFHKFVTIEDIQLPVDEDHPNPWTAELEFLKNIINLCLMKGLDYTHFHERKDFLENSNTLSMKGIEDGLFWMAPSGNHLELRPGFAFWPNFNTERFNHHAPVYYTVSSLLQCLRHNSSNGKPPPLKEAYVINQLDPLSFDRFNDGLIQAAFLRAAKPRELAYASDRWRSAFVKSLITKSLEDIQAREAEGLIEFLLALCLKRMSLCRDHICEIIDYKDKAHIAAAPVVYALLVYLDHVVLKGIEPEPQL